MPSTPDAQFAESIELALHKYRQALESTPPPRSAASIYRAQSIELERAASLVHDGLAKVKQAREVFDRIKDGDPRPEMLGAALSYLEGSLDDVDAAWLEVEASMHGMESARQESGTLAPVAHFLAERTLPTGRVPARVIYAAWREWCSERKYSPGREYTFLEALDQRGLTRKRTAQGTFVMGVTLKLEYLI